MIQIAPQIRILVAVEAIDGRKGIDAIAQLCREKLNADPFSGYLFIFRNAAWHGQSGFAVRRPRVLAGDQTAIQGTFSVVAHRHGAFANAASASSATAARGRQS
jgi:hypothetical protein